MNVVEMLIFICLYVTSVSSFSMTYYDCHKESGLVHYSAQTICKPDLEIKKGEVNYLLLQKETVETAEGFACQGIQSIFFVKCGVWQHSKMFKTPIIERIRSVQSSQCNEWISSGKYTHIGKTEKLVIPGDTIINGTEIGILSLDTNGNVKCAGQQAKIGNSISEDTVEMVQTRIIITKMNYRNMGDEIEVIEDHTVLPSTCRWTSQFCKTGQKTYLWKLMADRCPFKLNKMLNLAPIKGTGDYLVDIKEQVVLRKQQLVNSDPRCPNTNLYATEYSKLFLTPNIKAKFQTVKDIDFVTLMDSKLEYAFFIAEKEIVKRSLTSSQHYCKLKLGLEQKQEVVLGNGTFITRKGDLLYVNTCPERVAKIIASCHNDVKIADGYIDIQTRRSKKVSSNRPCEEELIVKANEGWVSIGRRISRVPTPSSFPATHSQIEIFNFHDKEGIYTKMEVEEYLRNKEREGYHKSISNKLILGACIHEGFCQEDPAIPKYNLNKLINVKLNPFESIENVIKEYGFYLALIVLFLETVKIIAFTVMVAITALNEGMIGVVALLVSKISCNSIKNHKKIRKNRKKLLRAQEVQNRFNLGACNDSELDSMNIE